MTYPRVINRNHLIGGYSVEPNTYPAQRLIAGDLRRFEQDARDNRYGQQIADAAGVPLEVAQRVLTALFTDCGHTQEPK
jgi:hypothetical protein